PPYLPSFPTRRSSDLRCVSRDQQRNEKRRDSHPPTPLSRLHVQLDFRDQRLAVAQQGRTHYDWHVERPGELVGAANHQLSLFDRSEEHTSELQSRENL